MACCLCAALAAKLLVVVDMRVVLLGWPTIAFEGKWMAPVTGLGVRAGAVSRRWEMWLPGPFSLVHVVRLNREASPA